jgi:hypothetical protein
MQLLQRCLRCLEESLFTLDGIEFPYCDPCLRSLDAYDYDQILEWASEIRRTGHARPMWRNPYPK